VGAPCGIRVNLSPNQKTTQNSSRKRNSFSKRTDDANVVKYLSTNAKNLGILKSERTRHRERDALSVLVWGESASLS
jgi:hypothetical protein